MINLFDGQCSACGGTLRPYCSGVYEQNSASDEFSLRKCCECGHGLTVRNDSHDPELYGSEFYDRGRGKNQIVHRLLKYLNRRNMLKIFWRTTEAKQLNQESSIICDYGCGEGEFVKFLKSKGYKSIGFEQSDFILNDSIDVRPTEEFANTGVLYDAVYLNHVLEHVENPLELLNNLRLKMKDLGIIYIEVPNFGSHEQEVLRCNNLHLDPLHHLHHFSSQSLHRTVRDAGFEILTYGGQRFKFPLVSCRSLASMTEGKFLPYFLGLTSILWAKVVKADSPCIWVVAKKS